jgi:8-oxo-dGTP diphosphatase
MKVEAAGGLLWRTGPDGEPEIALVHRPRYDDWSLPKGKLEPGEHPLAAALREVREEAGSVATPGRPLGRTRYVKDGQPKRVTYWAMRHREGGFSPNAEVDRLDWVAPEEAMARMHPEHDRRIVQEFLRDPRATRADVVVRHASAGDRHSWRGPDEQRPLDERGRRQALGLVPLLAAYGVTRAYSADVTRCLETLAPFARQCGVTVDGEPLLSETGYTGQPQAAVRRLLELVQAPVTAVFCTQAAALPDLVERTCAALGQKVRLGPVPKGSLVVLHLSEGADAQLLAVEQLPPPSADAGQGGTPEPGGWLRGS